MAKNRQDLRASIFKSDNKKTKSAVITLFGEEVEIRQPTLAQIAKLGRQAQDTKIPPVVRIMIEYIYVPGTDEKVFETGDAEQLASLPSGQWLNDLNRAIEELTGVDVKEAEKNSEEMD
jgi:hypothetical protein